MMLRVCMCACLCVCAQRVFFHINKEFRSCIISEGHPGLSSWLQNCCCGSFVTAFTHALLMRKGVEDKRGREEVRCSRITLDWL